jgi:hypothetical protein
VGIKQISVFLENNTGRLAAVTGALAKAGINLRAISIVDTADFGILRIIVDDHEAAVRGLGAAGFTTSETDVLCVQISDAPGALAGVTDVFQKAGLNIEYLYAALKIGDGKAVVILKLKDIETGRRLMEENNIIQVEKI